MNDRQKDSEGGDAGFICRKSKIFPSVHYIRTKYCGRPLDPQAPPKQIKEYYITTGLAVAYQGGFEVVLYQIQKPSQDKVH